mmetsp:Transcript_32357/g.48249  ORF Transcript_32357/g.48249 Transcript_32357/m.48249 type:complete len:111 (-) Transcript_32357:1371-1703(-)
MTLLFTYRHASPPYPQKANVAFFLEEHGYFPKISEDVETSGCLFTIKANTHKYTVSCLIPTTKFSTFITLSPFLLIFFHNTKMFHLYIQAFWYVFKPVTASIIASSFAKT